MTEDDAKQIGTTFAKNWIEKADADARAELATHKPRIPPNIDYALITEAERDLGSLIKRESLKRALRSGFWTAIEQ